MHMKVSQHTADRTPTLQTEEESDYPPHSVKLHRCLLGCLPSLSGCLLDELLSLSLKLADTTAALLRVEEQQQDIRKQSGSQLKSYHCQHITGETCRTDPEADL